METLKHFDLSALLWVNHFAHHQARFDHFIEAWINLNFLQGGFFFLFLWWMWFRKSSTPEADRIDAIRILFAVWGAIIIARALQIGLPHRLRPLNDPTVAFVMPYGGVKDVAAHFSSFPSDHAIVYFALATAIWARYRWLGAVCCLWTLIFACLSRVYAGYHYPGDVLVGAIIGILFMYVTEKALSPRAMGWVVAKAFRWERHHPASFYCVAVAITYECMDLFEDVRIIGRFAVKIVLGKDIGLFS